MNHPDDYIICPYCGETAAPDEAIKHAAECPTHDPDWPKDYDV